MKRSKRSEDRQIKAEFKFEATGTHWAIISEIQVDPQTQRRITDYVDEFENVFSRFRKKSLVNEMAARVGDFDFPDYAADLFTLYQQLEEATEGRMTPLIGKSLNEAGYNMQMTLQPQTLTVNKRIKETMKFEDAKITTAEQLQIDFAAAGKGLLIDLIGQFMEKNGRNNYTINGGGDIKTTSPIRVGLEHPADTSRAVGTADIQKGAICSSSPNRRQWGYFSHIIDGQSLVSPRNVASSWVAADTAMLADGLATALHLVPPEDLGAFSFEYALLHADGSVEQSDKFPGGFMAGLA